MSLWLLPVAMGNAVTPTAEATHRESRSIAMSIHYHDLMTGACPVARSPRTNNLRTGEGRVPGRPESVRVG
jgi:hypothetical protein